MFRVASDLRVKEFERNGMTVVSDEMEQCGCFYYFKDFDNAVKAAKEFDNMIVIVRADDKTNTSDCWYN